MTSFNEVRIRVSWRKENFKTTLRLRKYIQLTVKRNCQRGDLRPEQGNSQAVLETWVFRGGGNTAKLSCRSITVIS